MSLYVKRYEHPSGAYSVLIPDSWECSLTKNGIAIYKIVDGVGAINLSTFRATQAAPAKASEILVEGLPSGLFKNNIGAPVFEGAQLDVAYAEYEEDKLWWRAWIIKAEMRVVYATYNCDIEAKHQEETAVSEIVRSVRLSVPN